MLFLGRILLTIAVLAGLAYGALYALTTFVVPEQRDIVITIPMPKSPS
ncbi:MAG TPA: histidine kinase [Rhabdaerophilum sp.]|nr:histidine kinase [Rhabdaerophilum sp.]